MTINSVKKIKENDQLSDIPDILFMTLTEPQDIIKGLEGGTDQFITKPFNWVLSYQARLSFSSILE
jgi:DNA-binding response OmpR family regulator